MRTFVVADAHGYPELIQSALRDGGFEPFTVPEGTGGRLVKVCAGRFATWEEAEQKKKFFASNKLGEWGPWTDSQTKEVRQNP